MSFYQQLLRPLLFRLDAETAHNAALWAIANGLIRTKLIQDSRLETILFLQTISNPLGLAAGVDKNGIAVQRWRDLGFGYAEIGTLTPRPQPGNPKPRLFRYPKEHAVINRMGFNNRGAAAARATLQNQKASLPIGINLGKNKDTAASDAPKDYALAYHQLAEFADYVVINVSSPNTPGLRSLQSVEALGAIVSAIHQSGAAAKPLLVKIAPDLAEQDLNDICEWINHSSVAGMIATNTTLQRPGRMAKVEESGGLSGAPLRPIANDVLQKVSERLAPEKVLIGVGGIESGADIRQKLQLGANAVQVYFGWVFGGPAFPAQCLLQLLDLMQQDGVNSVGDYIQR